MRVKFARLFQPCSRNLQSPTSSHWPRKCECVTRNLGQKMSPDFQSLLTLSPPLSLVQDYLLSFAPDSVAGPSGLRPQHMKGAGPLRRGRHHGWRHQSILDRRCATRGFEEERRTPPPSCCGSTGPRMMTRYFHPLQLKFGTPNGYVATVHAIRRKVLLPA